VETAAVHPWPATPTPCPHCRLLIAAGRALSEAPSEPGARGAAAGVFSSRARRGSAESLAGEDAIVTAIRQVAEQVGERPERLLMVDYQQRTAGREGMPPLGDVLAVFGSWKQARRAAADG
jgi:hypothetical protein